VPKILVKNTQHVKVGMKSITFPYCKI